MKKFEHLGSSVMHWLRSRGLFQQPDLTAEQVFQLEECFHIFDADESGTVDIDEILAAMSLLGLPAERKVVQRQIDLLLKGKQQSGSADQSLKFEDFVDLMTTFFVNREKMTSAKEGREVSIVDVEEVPENQVEANIEEEHVDSNSNQVDFDLLAQALRRRNLLDAVMTDPARSLSQYQKQVLGYHHQLSGNADKSGQVCKSAVHDSEKHDVSNHAKYATTQGKLHVHKAARQSFARSKIERDVHLNEGMKSSPASSNSFQNRSKVMKSDKHKNKLARPIPVKHQSHGNIKSMENSFQEYGASFSSNQSKTNGTIATSSKHLHAARVGRVIRATKTQPAPWSPYEPDQNFDSSLTPSRPMPQILAATFAGMQKHIQEMSANLGHVNSSCAKPSLSLPKIDAIL